MPKQKAPEAVAKKENGNQFIRFDVELSPERFKKLDDLCSKCYRSRKNFTEALVLLAIDGQIDLGKLGIIEPPKTLESQ